MHRDGENCTTKLLGQTATSMKSEVTCHGRMEGVGHAEMSWRGNEHYEGTYSFKGSMEGHPQDISTQYTGDFVKADGKKYHNGQGCGTDITKLPVKSGYPAVSFPE